MRLHQIILLLALSLVNGQNYGDFSNKQVTRNIDLTSQFAKHTFTASVVSKGGSGSEYYVALAAEHLAFVEATDASGARLTTRLAEVTEVNDHRYQLVAVKLPSSNSDLTVTAVYTHTMVPYPASITQTERQLVRYADNHFLSSPYTTQTQTTTVKLPSANIESRSDQAPSNSKGDTVTYGPYEDIAPFTWSPLSLHFENNKPFLTVTSLTKEIEISHWSNVAVEETYQIQHDGATLKGAFSRYDYQRTQGQSPAHIPAIRQFLPLAAEDVYYRDEIGNISTSHLHKTDSATVLDLAPRFPLFGGWKFGYYMGYNLPSSAVLGTDSQDSGRFVLNITFACDLESAAVDELTVRVVLPEGARNPEVFSTIDFDSVDTTQRHFTYLDTTGRPVVEIRKKNVVAEHNRHFQVTYRFGSLSLFQEPFLLIGAFFVFFAAVMAYVRFEFNVGTKKVRPANAHKVDDLLLQFRDLMEQRFQLHQSLDSSLSTAASTKNVTVYNAARQRVEESLTKLRKEVDKVVAELEKLDGETARRVKDLEAKQERRVLAQTKAHAAELAHKVERKTNKAEYDRVYSDLAAAFDAVDQEIAGDVSDLTETM